MERTSLTVRPTQIHPDIPVGWFAMQVPTGTTLADHTFSSADGTQKLIDPNTAGDQMTGTVHSIN